MQINKKTPYYVAAMLLFLGLKFWYSTATTDEVYLLLAPTSKIVALITGAQAEYSVAQGFLFQNLHITIEKSCSGFNFWLLSVVLLLFQGIKTQKTVLAKLLIFPLTAFFCYLLTIVVNTSRILFAIKTTVITLHFGIDLPQKYPWLHEIEGAIIYLSALVAVYLWTNGWRNQDFSLGIKK